MSYISRLFITALLGLFLTACASTSDDGVSSEPVTNNTPTSTNTGVAVDPSLNNAFGTGLSLQDLSNLGIEGDPLNYKTVYFQYNSSAIDSRSRVIVSAHARYLQSRGNLSVKLEGHADERGTRDFNLALGERRAQTVSSLIKAVGATSPVSVVSYGEERPVVTTHNEAAWRQNRRVEISY